MESVKCYMPTSLSETLNIINREDCTILAGGSDLMVQNKRTIGITPHFDKNVVIVRNLKELHEIKINEKGECEIGSGCTSSEIAESQLCPWHLRQAASRMGAVALRNSATIGGNICNASPKGDTPGPLYLLDARVRIESINGKREELVSSFIKGYKNLDLAGNEMVTSIIVPYSEDDFDYVFWHKVGTRKANAISKITLSQALKFNDDGTVKDYRVSSTASGAVTNRSREVENILIGNKLDDGIIEKVIKAFDEVISPRAMPEFRREAVRRMIRRFLSQSMKKPEGKVIDTYDNYYMPGAPVPRKG